MSNDWNGIVLHLAILAGVYPLTNARMKESLNLYANPAENFTEQQWL